MTIVAVSDSHLGMKGAKENEFTDFIEYLKDRKIEHLVLLGDIIEIWRRNFTEAVMDFSGTMTYLNRMLEGTQIHYIAGNHDYCLLHLDGALKNDMLFSVEKNVVLRSKEQEFFFFHGYQLEVLCSPYYKSMKMYESFCEHMCLARDETGNAADKLWDMMLAKRSLLSSLKKFPKEPKSAFMAMRQPPEIRIRDFQENKVFRPIRELAGADSRHLLLHMHPEQYLIYGHTHDAYVDDARKVANTGSWGFGHEKKLEYIEIINDKVELKEFNPGS
ncbi:metallophosphoesterase family protein [uncultured Methanolobus sp.]|uniref:metallophosphoesterase family protein n=1 Tax=uncultured Methanolobus sp. TaxID=218300 RepID=UPI002AAC388C|nr:metallophosphoesterase family protein [uncultured Methanolobus sp.]